MHTLNYDDFPLFASLVRTALKSVRLLVFLCILWIINAAKYFSLLWCKRSEYCAVMDYVFVNVFMQHFPAQDLGCVVFVNAQTVMFSCRQYIYKGKNDCCNKKR